MGTEVGQNKNEVWSIDKLKNWNRNPRSISEKDFERLKKQIKKLGTYKPLLVNQDGVVLGGNMRLRALQDLGQSQVWVSIVEAKDQATMLEYALSDNDRAGEYDEEQLAELVTTTDIDLELYKVDLGKVTSLEDIKDKYGPTEEDEPPEVDESNVVSKLGEVYQLGKHRLMCGDSTDYSQIEKLTDKLEVDMVYTDPPYGLGGYGGRNDMDLKGDDEDVLKFYEAIPHAKEMYVWGNYKNLMEHLWDTPRDVIVWVKNNFGLGKGYRGQYELCFYYGNFSGSDSDVWQIDKDINYQHPTQKPVSLAVRAIKNSVPQTVLDIYGGSGSTLIACEQTGKVCYMMEIDPKYCDVIRKRYAKFINKEEQWQEVTPLADQPN